MEFKLKSRNIDLNEDIRSYVEKKIKDRVQKFLDKITKVEVEISLEKNPSINLNNLIEVTLFAAGTVIRATDSGKDAFEAIDKVSSKIDRQIKRYKNKIIQKSRKQNSNTMENVDIEKEEEKLQSIVRTKTFAIKPMTPEEATLQMELLGHDFFLFINSENNKASVVYKRKDENYGLIEPSS
jgi:putative sigma-54 modulation protein